MSTIVKPVYETLIFQFRGFKVMIDNDLSLLYGVPTKALKQQVKRNPERFPEDFMFELTKNEKDERKDQENLTQKAKFLCIRRKNKVRAVFRNEIQMRLRALHEAFSKDAARSNRNHALNDVKALAQRISAGI